MITLLLSVLILITSFLAFQRPEWIYRAGFSPYYVRYRGEWYRLFSHVLIHTGWVHLLVNLIVFFSFGRVVEGYFRMVYGALGPLLYLTFLAVVTVISCIPWLRKYARDPAYMSVGASGMTSGVLFASILLNPWDIVWLFFFLPLPAVVVGLLFAGYSWWMHRYGNDMTINHEAHLWGALGGILFPILLKPTLLLHFFTQLANPPL